MFGNRCFRGAWVSVLHETKNARMHNIHTRWKMRKDRAVYILALDYSRYIRSCAKWKAPHRSLIPREVLQKFIRTLYCTLCQLASTIAWMYVCAYRFLLLYSHLCVCVCVLLPSIFAKDGNIQLLAEANDYFVPFHTNTFYAYFHTLTISHLIQFAFFFLTLFSGLCGFDVVWPL